MSIIKFKNFPNPKVWTVRTEQLAYCYHEVAHRQQLCYRDLSGHALACSNLVISCA